MYSTSIGLPSTKSIIVLGRYGPMESVRENMRSISGCPSAPVPSRELAARSILPVSTTSRIISRARARRSASPTILSVVIPPIAHASPLKGTFQQSFSQRLSSRHGAVLSRTFECSNSFSTSASSVASSPLCPTSRAPYRRCLTTPSTRLLHVNAIPPKILSAGNVCASVSSMPSPFMIARIRVLGPTSGVRRSGTAGSE
mmetsp:Transcript_9165/g.22551  ORF Transcript_9165/g.22551 Transcript_9165/m.22551 type:complete len:200 (-) Transcript_9165:110-709(-)